MTDDAWPQVALADGTVLPLEQVVHQLECALPIREMLEARTGPFVLAEGPGPFDRIPSCARPLMPEPADRIAALRRPGRAPYDWFSVDAADVGALRWRSLVGCAVPPSEDDGYVRPGWLEVDVPLGPLLEETRPPVLASSTPRRKRATTWCCSAGVPTTRAPTSGR